MNTTNPTAAAQPNLVAQPGAELSPMQRSNEIAAYWDDEQSPIWEGIPLQVIRQVGNCDKDSAGGCG